MDSQHVVDDTSPKMIHQLPTWRVIGAVDNWLYSGPSIIQPLII